MYYKSVRIINGKPKWVINDDHGNIIDRNPTIELLNSFDVYNRRKGYLPRNKICCWCGSIETYKDHWYLCGYNKKGCTKCLCYACHHGSDWRTGNLDPLSNTGKGFIGQQIVAITYGVEDCNLKMNNFHFYIDLSKISEYGYCEVKIGSLNIMEDQWSFGTRRYQEYDTLLALCMDNKEPWVDVKRSYAFPWEVVGNRKSITITKNPKFGTQWYEESRIDSKPFNATYHNMKLINCRVLRKDE